MPVRPNQVKRILRGGGTVFGSSVRLSEPGLVECLGYAGFDFVIIDGEHGSWSWSDLERMVLAGMATEAVPMTRVLKNEPELVMRALDLGAMGVMIPHLRTVDDARRFIAGGYYAPLGERGIGPGRGTKWGTVPADEYFRTINDEVVLLAMLEDPEAVENIDAIAAACVPTATSGGIDVLWVGTGDLAQSYGVTGQLTHPKVMEASAKVLAACERHGLACGFPCRSFDDAAWAMAAGYRAIGYLGAEAYVVNTGRDFLKFVKG